MYIHTCRQTDRKTARDGQDRTGRDGTGRDGKDRTGRDRTGEDRTGQADTQIGKQPRETDMLLSASSVNCVNTDVLFTSIFVLAYMRACIPACISKVQGECFVRMSPHP